MTEAWKPEDVAFLLSAVKLWGDSAPDYKHRFDMLAEAIEGLDHERNSLRKALQDLQKIVAHSS